MRSNPGNNGEKIPAVQEQDSIEVYGAREHNLKDIDISIPKNKLVVITGISGSGKSSLAFDTIYSEGQRRYMETFGAYARQFIGDMERPDVDKITGLSPVISIEQKTTNKNPRSTVGTVTEIYDFLRLLFARIGEAYSYNTGKRMVKWSEEEIVENIFNKNYGKKVSLLAPLVRGRKGHYRELFEDVRKKGYLKVRVDGEILDITPKMQVDRYVIHDIELVVDRLQVTDDLKARLSQSVQQTLKLGKDLMFILVEPGGIIQYSRQLMCEDTGISYEEPSPNAFSFNSPYGACPVCKGLGTRHHINMELVIADPSLSINEGGIAPLGQQRDAWVFRHAAEAAKKNKIPLTTPINKLSEKQLNIMLYGNEEGQQEELDFENMKFDPQAPFEGVVNMLQRWFANPYSENIREWTEEYMELKPCDGCHGARLKKESLWFKVNGRNIADLSNMNLDNLAAWFDGIELMLDNKQKAIAKDVLKEIRERLQFLLDVGLTYLTLYRPSKTLSGGESQRIRLATQIGSQLQGITYILDEPSIGLHQRDNHRLIEALKNLRDIGNSVIVVEHDKDIMLAADHLVDIGPKAGFHGGRIVAQGTPAQLLKLDTLTSGYLNGRLKIAVPAERRKGNGKFLELKGATGNNLLNVGAKFPLGKFICVTGVSGSGKSTFINETLYPILSKHAYGSKMNPLPYKSIKGLEHIDKVIEIDQSPIGRTPRSNPATYCGFFTEIRTLFASIPEAKIRGYAAGRFSFNVKSGRCDVCEGGGMRVIEMNFLPDVYVHCEKCNGKRYNRETLEIRYKGKSIADVLEMTVEEAVEFFQNVPYLYRKIISLNFKFILMKRTIFIMAGIVLSFISLSASAQQTWDAKKNPTVDSITSQYTGKYIAPRAPLTTNDIFPVIGLYESSNTEAPTLTISLDQQNKGVVWVDGLPQGRIKAMLRKSPAIYKIPAQKTAEGKEVAEGTLIFDKENNTLNIALGKTYQAEDPASVFSTEPVPVEEPAKTSKTKTKKPAAKKVWLYSGTKVTAETVSN